MSTELAFDRRDFLFPFAKKGKKQAHPTNIDHRASSQSGHGGGRVTKREFIIGGGIVGLGIAVGLTRPWEQQAPSETLESLVAQAKRIENEYQGLDLSNGKTRLQYTNLLAQIFTKYYPIDSTPDQLASAVVFTSKEATDGSPATTKDKIMYINSDSDIFQKNKTSLDPKFPKGWNPLKSLRLTMLHEFSHEIIQPKQDEAIFSVVDAQNNVKDKKISGFRIQGSNSKNEFVGIYDLIDEASVELLSKYINTDLFNSFISAYINKEGANASTVMTRLEQVLNSAGINRTDFANLHRTSDLKGFLLLLAQRYGISPQKVGEKDIITFGFSIFEALIQNNQAILQDYTTSAKRLNK